MRRRLESRVQRRRVAKSIDLSAIGKSCILLLKTMNVPGVGRDEVVSSHSWINLTRERLVVELVGAGMRNGEVVDIDGQRGGDNRVIEMISVCGNVIIASRFWLVDCIMVLEIRYINSGGILALA